MTRVAAVVMALLAALLPRASPFSFGGPTATTGVPLRARSGAICPGAPTASALPLGIGAGGPRGRAVVQLRSSGDYVLDTFDPEEEEDELSNEAMLRIINSETPDQDVNLLVWKCLGYKQDASGMWSNDDVFPNWKSKYPNPPDLIGVKRNYTYEIDRPVQKANQALVKSIPLKYKQGVKEQLRPLGFTGFKLDELTPNKTRRAQCVNWMLFYREALRGKSLEQLRKEREEEQAQEAGSQEFPRVVGPDSKQTRADGGQEMKEQSSWKPPQEPVV